jgi:hypothetical protein
MPRLDFKGDVLKAGIAMGINGKCSRRKRPSWSGFGDPSNTRESLKANEK